MISLLASFSDPMADRLATGLNSTVLDEANEHWQEVGHLVDDNNRIYVTNLGDRIIFSSNL